MTGDAGLAGVALAEHPLVPGITAARDLIADVPRAAWPLPCLPPVTGRPGFWPPRGPGRAGRRDRGRRHGARSPAGRVRPRRGRAGRRQDGRPGRPAPAAAGPERAAAAEPHPPARPLLAGRPGPAVRAVQADGLAGPGQRRALRAGPGGRPAHRRAGPLGAAVRDPAGRRVRAGPGHRPAVPARRAGRPERADHRPGDGPVPCDERDRAGGRAGRPGRPAERRRGHQPRRRDPDGDRQPRRL